MSVLNHLAQAAAVLLLIYLLVLVIVFAAVAGGLAFGLRWARGKQHSAFDRANGYLPLATKYVHTGTDYAAKPFIKASGFAETVKGTGRAVRERVREQRARLASRRVPMAPPVVPPPVAVNGATMQQPIAVAPAGEETATVDLEMTTEVAARPVATGENLSGPDAAS